MTWLPISAARPGVTYKLLVNDNREAHGTYVLIGNDWHHASGRKLSCCKPTHCREVSDE